MELFKKSKFKKQTEEFLIEYHRLINDSRASVRELERLIVEGPNKIKKEEIWKDWWMKCQKSRVDGNQSYNKQKKSLRGGSIKW